MSTTVVVLAWIGLALGLVVALLVVWLFDRVVRPLLEIERYSRAILDAGLGITRNLDGVDLTQAKTLARYAQSLIRDKA